MAGARAVLHPGRVLIASVGVALGLDQAVLRNFAAVLLLAFGILLLSSRLQERFAAAASGSLEGRPESAPRVTLEGLPGSSSGLLLGLVGAPASVPPGAVTLASQGRDLLGDLADGGLWRRCRSASGHSGRDFPPGPAGVRGRLLAAGKAGETVAWCHLLLPRAPDPQRPRQTLPKPGCFPGGARLAGAVDDVDLSFAEVSGAIRADSVDRRRCPLPFGHGGGALAGVKSIPMVPRFVPCASIPILGHRRHRPPGDAVRRSGGGRHASLALTVSATSSGLVKFSPRPGDAASNPAGADVWVADPESPEGQPPAALWCATGRGYLQLCKLLHPRLPGRGAPRPGGIRRSLVARGRLRLVVALSGGHLGDVGEPWPAAMDLAGAALAWGLFPGAFYLEVQRYGQPQQELIVQSCRSGGRWVSPGRPPPSSFSNHDVSVPTRPGSALPRAMCWAIPGDRGYTEEQYFKTQAEMAELFADLPETLENAVEIARRCSIELTLGRNFSGLSDSGGMPLSRNSLVRGPRPNLEKRLVELYPDDAERRAESRCFQRLAFENDTIASNGLPRLFPHRRRLHQLGQAERVPRGAGTRFQGRLAWWPTACASPISIPSPALLFERFLPGGCRPVRR